MSDFTEHPFFATSAQRWQEIRASLRPKRAVQGAQLLSHGDAATHVWLVYSGWVKLVRQTPDGKETIVGLCTEGDMFCEAALMAGASVPYHAVVISQEADIASLPAASVREAMAQDAKLTARVMGLFSERMSQAQLKFEHMNTMSAPQRLGCFLLRLCYMQAEGSKTLHIPVEKHVLASYLGMKPETLSRGLQQLRELGISVSGADVHIDNIGRLREFVCVSCSQSGSCDVEDNVC